MVPFGLNIWRWYDGSPLNYTNWRDGEPNKCCGLDVSCVLVNYHKSDGKWDDAGCNEIWRNNQHFVCKQSATYKYEF
ncbi:unnamed protein product [Dracunculus medinensis]|uniref:C-type lectin domain-containing protein n=1 Tax=Dracunculus medinensis TaxID=318479 RepID=A0A0N4UG17_DRAME|nr:unnamed protein product [Dracunculus medinensis]